MKSQDILILLKLVSLQQQEKDPESLKAESSARSLEAMLGVSKSEVNASINRSVDAELALKNREYGYPTCNISALVEFLCHGIKYVFPVKPAELVRGVPTGFDAPVLANHLQSAGDIINVWPSPSGIERGQAIKPLYKSVPEAIKQDANLYASLALVDAIRIGNSRETKVAQKLLRERLNV